MELCPNLNYRLSSPSQAGVLTFPNPRLDFRPPASHQAGYGQTSGSAGSRGRPSLPNRRRASPAPSCWIQKGQACASAARRQL